jgi:glycosyltransferase involved in cell wall biosynthesis
MKLSICVPTYNRPEKLNRLIREFVEQCLFLDVELCISDNGNFTLPYHFKAIRYRKNKENIGFDRNLYEALKMGRGDWLWMMGDDDYPVGIKEVLEALDTNASIILLAHETDDLAKNPAGFMTDVIIRRSVFESLDKNWVEKGFGTLYFHQWLQVLITMSGNGGNYKMIGKHYETTLSWANVPFWVEIKWYVPWVRFRYWCLMLAFERRKNRLFFARKFITSWFVPILMLRHVKGGKK